MTTDVGYLRPLFRPSMCCEGLSEVIGGNSHSPYEPDWDFVRYLNCKRSYVDYDKENQ